MKFVDLFAGLGGFHLALQSLGGECVYAIELEAELRDLYCRNFGLSATRMGSDIATDWKNVPPHDVLCAGFPCQPFSKSGKQLGRADLARGTLFDFVVKIAKVHKPKLILLENVGNFERHDGGNTWQIVHRLLTNVLHYQVVGTIHKSDGGSGLLSPHDFGFPQKRDRFFAVASRDGFTRHPLPRPGEPPRVAVPLESLVQAKSEIDQSSFAECGLTMQQIECIEHWDRFVKSIPPSIELPSFPIWADEFTARYPASHYLSSHTRAELLHHCRFRSADSKVTRADLLARLPRYMTNGVGALPSWKRRFIEHNRAYFAAVKRYLPHNWIDELQRFPPSLRKLEWNAKGEVRDLWKCVLQFRPSGLRAKRYSSIPALVAMTTTQIPILGNERRFLTRIEALRLQGMPDTHALPESRASAFRALGNAVHVGVVQEVYRAATKALPRAAGKRAPNFSSRPRAKR